MKAVDFYEDSLLHGLQAEPLRNAQCGLFEALNQASRISSTILSRPKLGGELCASALPCAVLYCTGRKLDRDTKCMRRTSHAVVFAFYL
jgi:hypothetical protein